MYHVICSNGRANHTNPRQPLKIEGDESMLTGESMPVPKCVDDALIGAALNCTGNSQFRTTWVTKDTAFAQIVRLVREA
jgi:Cu+-exporting ATPase